LRNGLKNKGREKFVGEGWMQQAEKNCPEGKVPIVIFHLKRKSYDKDIVMLRINDFKDAVGKVSITPPLRKGHVNALVDKGA
jgi:hypothetical protein